MSTSTIPIDGEPFNGGRCLITVIDASIGRNSGWQAMCENTGFHTLLTCHASIGRARTSLLVSRQPPQHLVVVQALCPLRDDGDLDSQPSLEFIELLLAFSNGWYRGRIHAVAVAPNRLAPQFMALGVPLTTPYYLGRSFKQTLLAAPAPTLTVPAV